MHFEKPSFPVIMSRVCCVYVQFLKPKLFLFEIV